MPRSRRPPEELRRTLLWGYATPGEVDAVCQAARAAGVSVSRFVREAALAASAQYKTSGGKRRASLSP